MTDRSITSSEEESQVLLHVREGMHVFDAEGNKIGTVKYVQFPSEFVDVKHISGDMYPTSMEQIAEEVRTRLLREGFVRIEGGFFDRDRYVMPHQILDVQDESVTLNVLKSALIKS